MNVTKEIIYGNFKNKEILKGSNSYNSLKFRKFLNFLKYFLAGILKSRLTFNFVPKSFSKSKASSHSRHVIQLFSALIFPISFLYCVFLIKNL